MIPEPTFAGLYELFEANLPISSIIPADCMPEPYRGLLVHNNHMTVTVERHYQLPVTLSIHASQAAGDDYSREIVLNVMGRAVQYGVVSINLAAIPPAARRDIEAGQTPLGRVLINHSVMTKVQPVQYLRLVADSHLAQLMSLPEETVLYGRVGVIFAGGRPAIEVLEILAPVEADADRH